MSFNADDKKIYELFNRQCFLIPRNQRRYVWNKRNWNELFEDISLVVCENFPSHFIGSIVLKDEGRKNGFSNYTIIDGQQRIITLTILLASIIYCMKQNNMEEDYKGTIQYLITKDDKAKDIVMVTSKYHESLEILIKKIIESNSDVIQKQSVSSFIDTSVICKQDKNIGSAFKYFISRMQEDKNYIDNPVEYLIKMRNAVVEISYVSIISTTEEDSYTIFEILNARGLDLEDYELLKNYIMRYIHPIEDRDKAKEVWIEMEKSLGNEIKRFINHYTIHKFGYYRELSDYKVIQQNTRKSDVNSLLDDLRMKARYYLKFTSPTIGENLEECSEVEYKVFSFFKKKRYRQMRPVLLSLMHKMYQEEITKSEYEKIILYLNDFYICYNIIGDENSNKLSNCINKFALKMENDFSKHDLEDFIIELISKMPSYDIFLNSFSTVGWSHHRSFYEGEKNKSRVQTVLEVLERYENNDYCKENFTIEHILDDSLAVENALIGNLIPLEKELNRKCIAKSFREKCLIYQDSNYKTARNFSKIYKSKDEFNPKKRTEYMAKEFYYKILGMNRVVQNIDSINEKQKEGVSV